MGIQVIYGPSNRYDGGAVLGGNREIVEVRRFRTPELHGRGQLDRSSKGTDPGVHHRRKAGGYQPAQPVRDR